MTELLDHDMIEAGTMLTRLGGKRDLADSEEEIEFITQPTNGLPPLQVPGTRQPVQQPQGVNNTPQTTTNSQSPTTP